MRYITERLGDGDTMVVDTETDEVVELLADSAVARERAAALNRATPPEVACSGCGQLRGIDEYDARLRDLHERRRDGRQHGEALVFTADDLEGDDDHESAMLAMGRNMVERGLCAECGRPNLAGLGPDDFDSEEDARDQAAFYAEQAAEIRAGC